MRPILAVVDWQKKPLTHGRVDTIIEDQLAALPQPPYDAELCQQKVEALSRYMRTRHTNGGPFSVA